MVTVNKFCRLANGVRQYIGNSKMVLNLKAKYQYIVKAMLGLLALSLLLLGSPSFACGGMFCDNIPINQAGEQIVFRQQGGETTAMIKINYVGNAEDFAWVLPVPSIPDIQLGSDQIFTDLEVNTRPQFQLNTEGKDCQGEDIFFGGGIGVPDSASPTSSSSSSGSTGVVVDKEINIGPFDAKVISSDDAQALATWLADNNLDLTDRGSELLEPYIQAQSKFVVLKLKNNSNVGSIQPVILKYQSNAPVIPMTLTAVAAQNNMGVLVWLLGDGRGVPTNFKHVIPNYSVLDWFSGPRNTYISYQNLITQAMDEAGGQGFATDFAGYMPDLSEQLTTSQSWKDLLANLVDATDAVFIATVWNELNTIVQSAIMSALPTSNNFVYQNFVEVQDVFTSEQLKQARVQVLQVIQERVVAPLDNAASILAGNPYMTRLYTTLSADEMTKNPAFTYNTSMPEQPLSREATIKAVCINEHLGLTLTLGEGTGRNGEKVLEVWDDYQGDGDGWLNQKNMWRAETTSASSDPLVVANNDFRLVIFGTKQEEPKKTGGSFDMFVLAMLSLVYVFFGRRYYLKR